MLNTKYYIIGLLLLFALPVFAQHKQTSFADIDERVKSIPAAAPAELAYALTKDYTTEREKLRSIFSWIADHIAYRVKKNYGSGKTSGYSSHPVFTDTAKWKSANDMVAETVLQNKSAVCDGYARLFKALCDYAGLRSAIITGFAKGDLSRQLKFRCNHTWNAVYIDSAWQLLDITWASGYTNYSGDEFIKQFDENYFLAPPEYFIRDHFPDDLRWTLMDKPPLPREFNNGPYKNKSFTKYNISNYTPGNGIIEAAPGDTVEIMLETFSPLADSKMAADSIPVFDSSLQGVISRIALLEPANINREKNHLRYVFCVENNSIQWLHVLYNHDTVLRYRLIINKERTGLALDRMKGPVPTTFYP